MKAFLGGAKKYFVQNSVFIIFLILITVLSFTKLSQVNGDAEWFRNIPLNDLIGFTINRYQTWASRNIIEFILVICCHIPVIFALLNIIFCGVLYKSIYGVVKKKKNSRQLEFIVCASILASLIPVSLNSAGYIPTIMNYLWPVAAISYVVFILKKLVTQQQLLPRQYVFAILMAIFGANSEQCAAILFGATVSCIIYLLYKRKKTGDKLPKFLFVLFTISVAALIYIATCPGNAERILVETREHFPGYVELSLADKVLLGFSDIVTDMFAAAHPFYIAGLLVLGIAVFCSRNQHKNKWFYIILSTPAFLLAGSLLFEYFYHKTTGDFLLTRIPYFAEHGNSFFYSISMFVFVALLFSYLAYCFYVLSKKDRLFTTTLVIFLLAGVLSKVMIGFSPSIFFSEFRTTVPLYIALAFIFCLLFSNRQNKMRQTEACLTYSLVGVAALVNVILLFC